MYLVFRNIWLNVFDYLIRIPELCDIIFEPILFEIRSAFSIQGEEYERTVEHPSPVLRDAEHVEAGVQLLFTCIAQPIRISGRQAQRVRFVRRVIEAQERRREEHALIIWVRREEKDTGYALRNSSKVMGAQRNAAKSIREGYEDSEYP